MNMTSAAKLEILADPAALARRVADWMLEFAMAKDGSFAVALSGGSTPQGLYERLAEFPYIDAFPWARTRWFWGDERFVLHDNFERDRWVTAVIGAKAEGRITLRIQRSRAAGTWPSWSRGKGSGRSSIGSAAATTACRRRNSVPPVRFALLVLRRRSPSIEIAGRT